MTPLDSEKRRKNTNFLHIEHILKVRDVEIVRLI